MIGHLLAAESWVLLIIFCILLAAGFVALFVLAFRITNWLFDRFKK